MRAFFVVAFAVLGTLVLGARTAGAVPLSAFADPVDRYVTSDGSGTHTTTAGVPAFGIDTDGVGDVILNLAAGGAARCSGSLITSTHVLTAAHCVMDDSGSLDVTDGTVSFELSSGWEHHTYGAGGISVHPSYNGSFVAGFDVAIITLDSATSNVPSYVLNAVLGNEFLSPTVKVGYGRSGIGSTGHTLVSGTKRAGLNQYETDGVGLSGAGATFITNGTTQLALDFDSGSGVNDAMAFLGLITDLGFGADEVNSAPGDSGGPTFLSNGSIAGITSYGFGFNCVLFTPDVTCGTTDSSWGEISVDARVSSLTGFISTATGGAAVFVPEPSTATLLLIGLVMLSGPVRRRKT